MGSEVWGAAGWAVLKRTNAFYKCFLDLEAHAAHASLALPLKPTNIWTQNWIPRKNMMRPITSLVQNPPMRCCGAYWCYYRILAGRSCSAEFCSNWHRSYFENSNLYQTSRRFLGMAAGWERLIFLSGLHITWSWTWKELGRTGLSIREALLLGLEKVQAGRLFGKQKFRLNFVFLLKSGCSPCMSLFQPQEFILSPCSFQCNYLICLSMKEGHQFGHRYGRVSVWMKFLDLFLLGNKFGLVDDRNILVPADSAISC